MLTPFAFSLLLEEPHLTKPCTVQEKLQLKLAPLATTYALPTFIPSGGILQPLLVPNQLGKAMWSAFVLPAS